jgi:DNA polymerase III sliding clamp (beta) subunit (PCNA family)
MRIYRQELLDILGKIRPGLAAKEMVEQSANFLFLNGQVCTYNDEVLMSHPGCSDLMGSVQSKELFLLLSKMSSKEIELEIETTKTEMCIKSGTIEAGIALQADISEKLKSAVKELMVDRDWKSLSKDFATVVQQVAFAAGKEVTKPLLTCVHVTSQYAETCDNYRLARIAFPKRLRIKDLLLPARAIQNIAQYEPTQFAHGDGWAHFRNADSVQFSCRTMEGQYPDLSGLLQVEGVLVEFPDGILDSLGRSGVFLDDSVMGNEACSLQLADDVLEISARGVSGWIKEKLPVAYKGAPIEFQVLPKAFESILKRHPSAVIGSRSILFKGEGFFYCCSIVAGDSSSETK